MQDWILTFENVLASSSDVYLTSRYQQWMLRVMLASTPPPPLPVSYVESLYSGHLQIVRCSQFRGTPPPPPPPVSYVESLYSGHLQIVRCSQFRGTAECVQTRLCLYSNLVPRTLPDFISQPWEKMIFLYSYKRKSGSGLGTRLPIL